MEKFLNNEKIMKKFSNRFEIERKRTEDKLFLSPSKKYHKNSLLIPDNNTPKKINTHQIETNNTEEVIDKTCVLNTPNEDDSSYDLQTLFQKVCEGEKIIENSNKINCIILKYGNKPSNEEIEYTFCKTCDSNLINPICIECIKNCHKDHTIKKNFLKGNIQCNCGQRLHNISVQQNFTDIISCTFSEWSLTSKLYYYYKKKRWKLYLYFLS